LVKKGYAYRLSMTFSESTRFKMKVAHAIFAIMRFLNIREERVIYRGGLKFEVDISEGIDLSLFLFGHFQNHVTRNKFISLPKDAVIFDVGANFGSISLPFATGHDHAVVYAFEPTHSAMAKLKRNIELNVDILGRRVYRFRLLFQTRIQTPVPWPRSRAGQLILLMVIGIPCTWESAKMPRKSK
jgi:hypothetical protein